MNTNPSSLWLKFSLAAALFLMPLTRAQAQGITQPTFTAGEVNTIIYTFPQTTVGDRVTIGDFQHGQLYLASGSSGVLVRDTWWNMSSMAANRTPVLIQQLNTTHDKSHNIGFWKTFFTEACNGTTLHIWDFTTRAQVGSINGTINSLWDSTQAPYIFTAAHGYSTGTKIEVWNVSNPAAIVKVATVDTGTAPGFQIGSTHALGNLLICSATETAGVAVYDISDPANPLLLDSRIDGTSKNYTSLVYGSRVYNCERTGIRVYDFSNPNNIVQVGTPIATGGTPRYIVFKDGKGYCATGSQNIKVFDTTTLAITATIVPDGKIMDFVYPFGNMAIVGGGGAGGNSTNGARIMAMQQNPDTTGPAVVYVNPVTNAVNVALTSRIGFSLSDQIDVTSLTTNSFIVRPVGTTPAIAGTYSTMMGLINFSPGSPLSANTTYEVILTVGGVKDVVGNGIAVQHRTTFTTISTAPTGDGLAHRWPLDGTFVDTVGANNGTATGVTFTNGMSGQAGLFDGADFINVGTLDFGNSFTLAGWVWVDTTATNLQTIAANSAGGSSTAGFRFGVNTFNTTDRAVILETGNGTVGNSARTSTNAVTPGAWNHIALVIDRTAGLANIYVNGTNLTTDGAIRNDFTVNAVTHLGQLTGNSSRLHGRLDEMRVYNKQLSASEVGDLMSRTHHWPLDGTFVDLAGSNDGVNTGVTFTNVARVGTQAGVFDGADSVNVGTINLGNAFSLATWVWIDAGATNIQTLMANASGGAVSNGFRLFVNTYNTSDGAVNFETANGTANNNGKSAVGVIATNAWNHVAAAVDRAAGTVTLYVNGTNVTADASIRNDFNNNALITLGQFTNNSSRLHGRMDDVRIYDKVLSAADVAGIIGSTSNSLPVISSLTAASNPSLAGASVTFTVNATDANKDALNYSFDFGDGGGQGAFTLNKSAAHTYANPGRYTVFGRVRDAFGTTTTNLVQIVHLPLTATNAVASSQIIYDASRNKVWNVNPDSDTVTRIDGNALTKDFEITVGRKPRTLALRPNNSEVWVACEGTDQIYILSATNGAVLQTNATPRGSRPMGVAFQPDGGAAYVTYMNSGLLAKWNPTTRALVGTLDVGPTPRAIAISGDSTRIFVGRFVSPVNPLTPGAEVGEVREVGAAAFTVTRLLTLAHDAGPDTESASRGTPNYLLQMAVTPDGQRLFVPSKKDNVDRGGYRDTNSLTHDTTVRAIFSKINLVSNSEALGERVDVDNHSLIHGVTFSPMGDLAFIAFQGNNEIGIFNAYSGQNITGIDLGAELSPQDLVMKPDGSRLFVLNFMTRSVSAFDVGNIVNGTSSTATPLAVVSTVAAEKLSAQVLQGKQIFYNAADPRMSGEGYISCASCHIDGGHDARIWDFTDRGEGLRNTIPLDGRRGTAQGNVHWTANFDEIQDFELDIRNGFAGLGFITNGAPNVSLGAPNAGRSAELDALAAYVSSLSQFKRSPYRNNDGTLTSAAVAGRQIFAAQNCASCHAGSEFTDSVASTNAFVLHDVGTIHPGSGKRLGGTLTGFDTPTLKGLWETPSYLHDGFATNLLDVITTQNPGDQHGVTSTLNATQKGQLVAYLQQIDDLEIGGQNHLWSLEGNVNDSIGTNNGVNNGVTFTTGKVGQSGVFNGTNYINVSTLDFGNNFSVAAWVWVNTTATNIQMLMANSSSGSSANGFRLFVNTFNTTDHAISLETGNGTTGNSARTSTNAVTFGAWNHVALVVDRVAGQARIYVNGTDLTTDSSITTNFNVNAVTHIGQMTNNAWRLHGQLDEVSVFNHGLSASEIAILFGGDAAISNGALDGGSSGFAMMSMGGALLLAEGSPDPGSGGGALPSPWQAQDVGAVSATGGAGYTNGVFTVTGSGADIWGTADEFQYVVQTATGDCEIKARVNTVGNTDPLAKAGIMIRETLGANARHASLVLTPANGALFLRRTSVGGTTASGTTAGVSVPYWVRLQRTGNTFTASLSTDGVNWIAAGSATINMGTSVYIGLGVTSRVDGTLNTSTFDNVTATP